MIYVIQILAAILIGISIGALFGNRSVPRVIGAIIGIVLGVITIFTGNWVFLAIGAGVYLVTISMGGPSASMPS